ncbi:glycoside hydrolase superfamily [Lentinula raphanica]|uniref:Glycoside hydrolase superfamily n=1 Tax=Lentinula raphanica TaxID=153919 RepID=A0AA38P2J9_9AGAR|nr:glycoside hydrolase superfamily [Lentinula raphanica]KAJ3965473.1 glycoside hydrolase superfamily [Lentinula raphanica]
MSKFMQKLQSKIVRVLDKRDGEVNAPSNIPALVQPPTPRQIYHFRKQHGVNLGSWFTLENWLTPSLFQQAADPKSSEMDVLRGLGPQGAKSMLENHWAHLIDAGDWRWLVQHGINTVRIPVSYYHFLPGHPDPEIRRLMHGTEFEPFAEIYTNAWKYVVSNAIQAAREFHIGVLIDLHAAPGAQNTDSHSGLSGGKAGLWDSKEYQKRTVQILVAMAQEIVKYDNVVGLELLNEPKNNNRLMSWYDEAIGAIRAGLGNDAQDLPIYISDAWDTNWYSKYVNNHSNPASFLVLDHHLYRCFTNQDQSKSASQHANEVHPSNNGPSASMLANASKETQGSLVIGEWSAALDPASLSSYPDHGSKLAAQREWGVAQWEAYDKHCAGSFFWTLKKEGQDRGWCYYTAVEQGVIPAQADRFKAAFREGKHSVQSLEAQGQMKHQEAMQAHVAWWSQHSSNPNEFEHWRFEEGFKQGWNDSMTFFFGGEELGGSEIGFWGQWKRLRTEAHRKERGNSKMVWEFEHGLEQAIRQFKETLL